jgi:hypothetical protein
MPHSSWAGHAHLELGTALAGQGNHEAARAEIGLALEHLEHSVGTEAQSTRRARAQMVRLARR